MIFYHGTDQIVGEIDFSKSRLRTDFGRGFYLSDKLGNARDWAVDKAGVFGIPTVMRYEIDDSIFTAPELKCLRHDKATIDWLNFVRDNRRKTNPSGSLAEPRHTFDVVTGPIANDKVAVAVDRYCRGKLTAGETLKEIRTISAVFQMSIHTAQALTFIRLATYSQYKNKQWTAWRAL